MDRYRIGVDIGEGSDFVVLYLIEYKDGEIGCNYIISNVKVKLWKRRKRLRNGKKPLMRYLNEVEFQDSIRVSQYGIVHEPMSTLIFDNGIGEG